MHHKAPSWSSGDGVVTGPCTTPCVTLDTSHPPWPQFPLFPMREEWIIFEGFPSSDSWRFRRHEMLLWACFQTFPSSHFPSLTPLHSDFLASASQRSG